MQNENNGVAVKTTTVCKGFGSGETRTEVLKEVNFEARLGELLLLVGPSGCGKTTLLSVIAGTLTVDRGEVMAFNAPLHTMDKKAVTRFRAENIGFIFQQYNLIPTLNCIENVSVPLRIQGASAAVAEKRAAEVLTQVGLGSRMHHRPNMLSGGQQQRVAIARALVHEPKLIICDEPTAALDSENGAKVMEILKNVAAKPDRCVIIVTHDNRIFKYADRMVHMEDGRISQTQMQEPISHQPHYGGGFGLPLPSTGEGIEGEGWFSQTDHSSTNAFKLITPHPGPLPVEGRGSQPAGGSASTRRREDTAPYQRIGISNH